MPLDACPIWKNSETDEVRTMSFEQAQTLRAIGEGWIWLDPRAARFTEKRVDAPPMPTVQSLIRMARAAHRYE